MNKYPARKTTRLKKYDYAQSGYYYVTICAENRNQLLGTIKNDQMILNDVGNMVNLWWQKMVEKYNEILNDQYMIMPNHIHGIINITVGAIPCNRPNNRPIINTNRPIKNNDDHITKNNKNYTIIPIRAQAGENMVSPLRVPNKCNGLGQYLSWFKRMTTNKYIQNVKNNNWSLFDKRLWQRNYYDHIIRNDKSLQKICEYIVNNPATWNTDENNIKNA